MKITDVCCFVVPKAESPNGAPHTVILIIETDEGFKGVSEATLAFPVCLASQVVPAIYSCKEFLIGQDPGHIERIWAGLNERYFWKGGPVQRHALGAINNALWDIAGKSVGRPVYMLFGGACHERIPLYHNGWWAGANDTAQLIDKALAVIAKGASRIKWYPFKFLPQFQNNFHITRADMNRAVNEVIALREAVGAEVEIMVDVWRRLDLRSAIEFCNRIEGAGLVFIEEAIPADNIDSMIKLSQAVNVRLAAGERIINSYDYSKVFEAQAISVAQINVGRVGGLSEARKIATMADNYGIGVAPHNPTGALATAAAVQLCASLRNFALLERYMPQPEPWIGSDLAYGPDYIDLPTAPGLGITLDEAFLKHHAV